MPKYNSRQKKIRKKGNVGFALGCLLLLIAIPLILLAGVLINNNKGIFSTTQKPHHKRIKTKYEKGLVVSFSKKWILIGSEFPKDQKQVSLTVKTINTNIPDNLLIKYRYSGDTKFLGTVVRTGKNEYKILLNAEDLGAGEKHIEVVATSDKVAGMKWTSKPATLNVSYALYIVWSIDWEGMAVSNGQLSQMSRISTDHKNLPIVHFFNPRVFSGGLNSTESRKQINYVLNRQKNFGDEIGLHLHMWYDIARAAGVTPRNTPAWNSPDQVSVGGGYDVPVSAYPYDEFVKILQWSLLKFKENGLGVPISFRAGGWYLDLENIHALQDTGFRVDSSGRDARFWGRSFLASPWSLGARTLPYKISTESLNSDFPKPVYNIWEIPDNGADSYWFSAADMITAVNDNFMDKPLKERRIVTLLSHPHWFSTDYPKLQKVFSKTDSIYYGNDTGPVLYTTHRNFLSILEAESTKK